MHVKINDVCRVAEKVFGNMWTVSKHILSLSFMKFLQRLQQKRKQISMIVLCT